MLVKLLHFGCNWWARFGSDPGDPDRYTRHAAYYNSTGIRRGGKTRRCWIVPGLVRFNGVGDFNPHFPQRSLGHTFVAAECDSLFGGNRLLLGKRAAGGAAPDRYLVVISSELHGRLDFLFSGWKSPHAQVIAASQRDQAQEAMLLMKPGDWVRSNCGFWRLALSPESRFGAALDLCEERSPA